MAVILVCVAAVRLRLLNLPLERDEGEFAYMGRLLLEGVPPYKLAFNMKMPGIYLAYAAGMALFGQTVAGIHATLMVVNLATIVLVFLLGRRLLGGCAGIVAAAVFAVMSCSPSHLGFAGHATNFVTLAAVGGLLVGLRALESRRSLEFLAAGLLMGISFLMKQPGAFLALFLGIYILWSELRARPAEVRMPVAGVSLYALGALLPFALTCLWLWNAGVFDRFWFWTFSYASQYASQLPIGKAYEAFTRSGAAGIGANSWTWGVSAVGLAALAWDARVRRHGVFLVGLLLFSAAAVCPGFYFREHYFVPVFPALGLLAGAGVVSCAGLLERSCGRTWSALIPAIPLLLALSHSVDANSEYLFRATPEEACRITYGVNPFPESIRVAEYIEKHSKPGDKVFVFGSEPQIYFLSDRRSATGHIYMYGLVENHAYARRMQAEMIREVEANNPRYVVFVYVTTSWLPHEGMMQPIIDWFNGYANRNLRVVGVVDILSTTYTEYCWGEDAASYRPMSSAYMIVLERQR